MASKRKRANSSYNVWSWQYTELKNNEQTMLSIDDIKQLLVNRGEDKNNMDNYEKSELIELLKDKYCVFLGKIKIANLSSDGIMAEIRLHRLNDRSARLTQMRGRLNDGLIKKLPKWTQIENHPFKIGGRQQPYFSKSIRLNNNEYIISDNYGLYKYMTSNMKWNEWIKYPDHTNSNNPILPFGKKSNYSKQIHLNLNTLCINKYNKSIYFFDHYHQKLLKLNYETEKMEVIEFKADNINIKKMNIESAICIDNELHIFRNDGIIQHLIFDEKNNKFNQHHRFEGITNLRELIYISTQNKMYLMGNEYQWNSGTIKLFSYCCKTRKWRLLPITFPRRMRHYKYGMIGLWNNEYIIIYPKEGNNIYVIDMEEMELIDSNVQCPKDTNWNGMIINTEYEQELVVFGFIRQCWNNFEIGMDMFPPQYLIRLIESWYTNPDNDYLHLFEQTSTATNWQIKLGFIINNLNEC